MSFLTSFLTEKLFETNQSCLYCILELREYSPTGVQVRSISVCGAVESPSTATGQFLMYIKT